MAVGGYIAAVMRCGSGRVHCSCDEVWQWEGTLQL